jgi:hypothetical protein
MPGSLVSQQDRSWLVCFHGFLSPNMICLIFVMKDGLLHKTADWTLAVAIPVHMHITTNALVTDYVDTKFRGG